MTTGSKNDKIPDGALFSQAYLRAASTQRDSPRFRMRVHSWWMEHANDQDHAALFQLIGRELGVRPPGASWGLLWEKYFATAELRDLLDTLTLINRTVAGKSNFLAQAFGRFVTGAFYDESLGYAINEQGGVRFAVDAEYERNRFSVIDGLGDNRYAAVRHAVENAFRHLDAGGDRKAAVRDMFEAAEILAKLMSASNEDLDEKMVQRRLKPIAQKLHSGNPSAVSFGDQMLEGFAKWVSAGHKYRHGQKTEEPVAPPFDMAVAYVSAGASHIRFLASLDQMTRILS